ncbi:MAG TPA: hypothetical protein PKW33_09365 [Anaerolineaceae bacterium]|nr:hypothetical protein [Anaerolineaceae bacterium]HPN51784.1 hypothetical protein [Anaerolineaceae bacterium]
MNTPPSASKIFSLDYWTFLFAVVMIVFSLMALFDLIFATAANGLTILLPGLALLAAAGLAWRLTSLVRLYRGGQLITGVIEEVMLFRGRGRIAWKYSFNGRAYTGSVDLSLKSQVAFYQPGQAVDLLVDPLAPRRSILAEIFK